MARRPDFILKALHKKTDTKATVGAGWDNGDGSISVQVNNYITLEQDGYLLLTLFPNDKDKYEHRD